jgi:hypothetical protein
MIDKIAGKHDKIETAPRSIGSFMSSARRPISPPWRSEYALSTFTCGRSDTAMLQSH